MLTMDEMKAFLPGAEADFQLAGQDAPLLRLPVLKSMMSLARRHRHSLAENENGLLACIVSSGHGRLDVENMRKRFGHSMLKMAPRQKIEEQTAYETGGFLLSDMGCPDYSMNDCMSSTRYAGEPGMNG